MTAKARVEILFTVWAFSPPVKKWVPLMSGLNQQVALDEMIERQDRIRRSKFECRFAVRPDGKHPDDGRGTP